MNQHHRIAVLSLAVLVGLLLGVIVYAEDSDVSKCPKDCLGSDSSKCVCNALEGRKNVDGKYSCSDSKCQYCANKFTGCRFNGTEFPCCSTAGGVACYELNEDAAKRYKITHGCLPACQKFNKFLDFCTDSNGRKFPGRFKSCKGSKPNTWISCPSNYNDAVECGATGNDCIYNATGSPVDNCCTGLYCADVKNSIGKCQPECSEDDSSCKINLEKGPCANATRVDIKKCKDKNGREFGPPGRYLSCSGSKPNTFIQCPNTYNPPKECGSTGANCSIYDRIKACCTNFKCSKKNSVCVPECPKEGSENCKPQTSITSCAYDTQFKTCKDGEGKKVPGYYLACKGSKEGTMIQCPNINYNSTPVDCPVSGSACTYNISNVPTDACCTGMECKNEKCVAECPGDDTNCKYNSEKSACSEKATSVKPKNCTLNGRVFSSGRFLECKGSKSNSWVECNLLSDSTPPRECGVTGASCKLYKEQIDTCCTGFVCGIDGKCVPECPENAKDCFINRSFAFCSTYHQAPKNCTDSTGVSKMSEFLLCKGKGDNTFVDCGKDGTPRDCGTTGFSCADKLDVCCKSYTCGEDKKCKVT